MISYARSKWEKWIKKRNDLGNPQTFHSHNIYILPSGFGWAYGVVVFVLFLAAINYQINTIFLMCFLLIVIGLISAWEAHANLKNISMRFVAIEDAEQGIPAQIALFMQTANKIRYGVELQIAEQPKTRLEKIPDEGVSFIIPIDTPNRGVFLLPRIIIGSVFPFGIFKVWGYAYFQQNYFVYPQPINPGFWPEPYAKQHAKKKQTAGNEEFYDLKQVENPWIEPKQIAWKIAAKGQGWYLKTMQSPEFEYWLFKLSDLPSNNLEAKLQHLSYWLQTAELNGLVYGLELPAMQTPFANGKEHLHHCLRQLALYQ